MYMSMEAIMEFYTRQPAWALEFLPNPSLSWRCSPPKFCVRRSQVQGERGWDCKVCCCEATAAHIFSPAHVKACYWATYGDVPNTGNWEPAVKGMLENGQPALGDGDGPGSATATASVLTIMDAEESEPAEPEVLGAEEEVPEEDNTEEVPWPPAAAAKQRPPWRKEEHDAEEEDDKEIPWALSSAAAKQSKRAKELQEADEEKARKRARPWRRSEKLDEDWRTEAWKSSWKKGAW